MSSERIPVGHVEASVLATGGLITLRHRLEPIVEKLRSIPHPTIEDVEEALG